ncbi:hypothetical protein GF337_15730 [candidate division KSB1 bacterium]|nr:hypothetical protein [candidate division KSB1 bacterium]
MFNIARQKHIRNFYLAKTVRKAPHIEKSLDYGANLKRSVIVALLFTIICLKLFPHYTKQKIYKDVHSISTLEVIDIPVVKPEEPPPPPPVKIVEPMKMVRVKEPDKEKKDIKEEVKDLDLKLDIDNDDSELLLASSQLGDLGSANFSTRNIDRQSLGSLELEYSSSRPNLHAGNPLSLELGLPDANVNKKYKEKSIDLDTKSLLAKKKPKPRKKASKDESSLEKIIKVKKNQFLLRESESTIGTTEFKTWNRINAVLDRLNKDRYGELPDNVKRISNGLAVSFSYRNGKSHDIFWSKGGKVIIRVTGVQPNSNVDELRTAYDALLRLLYNINS